MAVADLEPVDLVVTGCVAVGLDGTRLGKGGGIADLEFALAAAAGLIGPDTLVVTTVHELQVRDAGVIPSAGHDAPVDLAVTPERTIARAELAERASALPGPARAATGRRHPLVGADRRQDRRHPAPHRAGVWPRGRLTRDDLGMAQAVLIGGAWDGHVEEVALGDDGLPPERLPRSRDTSVWTEDTGFLPMRIPAQGYRRRGPDPRSADRWFYEPDPDD